MNAATKVTTAASTLTCPRYESMITILRAKFQIREMH